ncbi:MAG: RNA methyltransferase [Parasporobacterium sp.]|nr:RNA methyltransferase [Parasporobacterium sp.]
MEDYRVISITDFDKPELKVYSGISEPQLYHYYEPEPGLFIAESPMIISRALDAGYVPESFLTDERTFDGIHEAGEILAVLDRVHDVPVYTAPMGVITGITGYALTRGLLCAMRRRRLISPEEILKRSKRIAVFEDVMNPSNTGAIFRSAAALGMDGVLLTTGCTDPLYRRSARVSMGTVFQIPWTYIDKWGGKEDCRKNDKPVHRGVDILHAYGFRTVAMALCEDSINIRDLKPVPGEKIALILGSEGPGLHEETIEACDAAVKIPMAHGVDSLNVAAASAIAFWQISNN